MFYQRFFKYLLDFTLSLTGFLFISPLFLLITLFLFLANDGKPFFFQQRPGKKGNIFKVIKFRTMNDLRDAKGNLLPDKQRLTRVGAFVRKTSLDEIPQLINVIKRDMSLVGPRPLLPEYLSSYSKEQARRHEVRHGITGSAQVNGRNTISWQKKFELDVWYVDHLSFLLDVKILWLTVLKVVRLEGISSGTNATMEKFTGNN